MSGAGTPWSAYGAPVADIDRVEVIHHADGRREYIYAEPMEVARERLRLHREHAEAQERERLAQVEHDQRIQERVAAFIATSAPQINPTARGRLAQHLARVKRAEGLAAASRLRLAEVSHAEVRRAEAQAAFDQLEVEVRAEYFAWLQYGSTSLPPPGRGDERARLRQAVECRSVG
jgi:hypothetical protein